MSALIKTLAATFVINLLFFSSPADACKLGAAAYDLEEYLNENKPNQVVFVGKVVSVEVVKPSPRLLLDQKIEFEVDRWWRGAGQKSVSVRGMVEKPTGTSCDGQFDFSVKSGEEWLIVGYIHDGVVDPMTLLSLRIKAEAIPEDTLKILNGKH